MEPSQPSYNTFGSDPQPSSAPDYYPSPSSQPYMGPSEASYNYAPGVSTYPSPAPAVYPVDGGYPTPSYHTEVTYPVHSSPAYGTADNCCADCCGLLCCAGCFGLCAACLSD